jgi:RHS repeat-associated protein
VTDYYHGDMLGTTRLMSNSSGSSIEPAVYTAFGERITAPTTTDSTRYGYVGAWGYQGNADFPYLHVGARYYDPSSGRFLQRDPIGIRGGTNAYNYARSKPSRVVDPSGLIPPDSPSWRDPGPYIPPGDIFGPPPSPRDVQKGAQWTAAGCAVWIGFLAVPGAPLAAGIIGGAVLILDILEYVEILPPAPDTWEEATDWGGGGAG